MNNKHENRECQHQLLSDIPKTLLRSILTSVIFKNRFNCMQWGNCYQRTPTAMLQMDFTGATRKLPSYYRIIDSEICILENGTERKGRRNQPTTELLGYIFIIVISAKGDWFTFCCFKRLTYKTRPTAHCTPTEFARKLGGVWAAIHY